MYVWSPVFECIDLYYMYTCKGECTELIRGLVCVFVYICECETVFFLCVSTCVCFIVPIIFGNNLQTRRNYLAFLKFVNVVRVLSVFCQNEILMWERDFKDAFFLFFFFLVSFFFFLDDFGKILAISERFYIFYFFFLKPCFFPFKSKGKIICNSATKWKYFC